jgi:Glycosyl transferases group 1
VKRVLLIGMADSIHVARWLDVAANDPAIEILMVPTSPHRRIHPKIQQRLSNHDSTSSARLKMSWLLKVFSLPIWVLDRDWLFGGKIRAAFIAQEIKAFSPHLVHIMETQNGGYPFALAQEGKNRSYKTMLTLFGSDLFWFSQFPNHLRRIKELLPLVDVLSAECARDIAHAQELGFAGRTLKLTPVSGGLEASDIASEEAGDAFASRDLIAVKGYGGTWGQGAIAIQALGTLSNKLKGRTVVIYSAEKPAIQAAKKYLEPQGVSYRIHKKFGLSHKQVLELYRKSRIYVGLSRSDGLPASMLEAMSQGAYPIQTSTACLDGWLTDGVTGTSINMVSLSQVAKALDFALGNDDFLIAAQKTNLKTIREKYSKSALSDQSVMTYAGLLG